MTLNEKANLLVLGGLALTVFHYLPWDFIIGVGGTFLIIFSSLALLFWTQDTWGSYDD